MAVPHTSSHYWLNKPFTPFSLLATPYDAQVRALYDSLKPLVICNPPEQDWLGLTHLFRNKILHFGQGMLRIVGLYDMKGTKCYVFIPRQWPFIYERYMKPKGMATPHDPLLMRKLFEDSLIHQEIMSFVEGSHLRVFEIIRVVASWIAGMCKTFESRGSNADALVALETPLAQSPFEHFT